MAPVDHVRLSKKAHLLPGELHSTRGRDLPAFTSISSVPDHRLTLIPQSPSPPALPTLLFLLQTCFFLSIPSSLWVSGLFTSFSALCPSITETCQSLLSAVSHPCETHVRYFSQASNTHNLFFSVIIPQISPPCSSSVIKLSSEGTLTVFIPVNWALWWTVNKPMNHTYNLLYF